MLAHASARLSAWDLHVTVTLLLAHCPWGIMLGFTSTAPQGTALQE